MAKHNAQNSDVGAALIEAGFKLTSSLKPKQKKSPEIKRTLAGQYMSRASRPGISEVGRKVCFSRVMSLLRSI